MPGLESASDLAGTPAHPPRWHPATRIAFRFCVVYFALYLLPLTDLMVVPGVDTSELANRVPHPLYPVVAWVGAHEVFTLNMTYDVEVKTFSFHLLLIAVILVAPSVAQLWDFFLRRRAVRLPGEPVPGKSIRTRRTLVVAQIVLAAYFLTAYASTVAQWWERYAAGAPKSALYGIWNVDQMRVDGQLHAPLLTDTTRWRRLIFQYRGGMAFEGLDDRLVFDSASIDTTAHTHALSAYSDSAKTSILSYERPTPTRLIVDGTLDGHAVDMELSFVDPDSYALRGPRFHWVHED